MSRVGNNPIGKVRQGSLIINFYMKQKTYLTILRTGIYLAFLSVFLVWGRLVFPYISTKQIYFNVLIELLFIFWLAFIIKYPGWRPKWSLVSAGLVSFFAVITLSCFTGVDFNLSFWGDVERMLGVFHLFHFLVFYFIIITVMRTWSDWRKLFLVSVGAAVLVSFHGFGQKMGIIKSPWGSLRIIATIGNAAYVGAYAIFNIYFCFILFFKEKNRILKSIYPLAALAILLMMIFSGTRGAFVGFGASIFVLLLLFAFLNKNKRVKKYSLISFVVFIILIATVFFNSDKAFVKNNSFLGAITHISLSDITMQTRFISWKAAWQDFGDHPILGTGHGNFAMSFDKYFDSSFYNYTRTETYFDRAHNNFIDIGSTTGLLGLLTYLSIFAFAGYYLVKGFAKGKIGLNHFILITCLLIAYFVQSLVLFDALVTYISIMMVLGYVYYLSQKNKEVADADSDEDEEAANDQFKDKKLANKEIYVLLGAGIIMLTIIFQFNIKPLKMLVGSIDGQLALRGGDVVGAYEIYKETLGENTILDRDSRTSLIRSFTASFSLLRNVDKEKAQEIVDYIIEQAKKNIAYNPKDSLMQTELARILELAALLNTDSSSRFFYYADQALEAVDKAIASSPGRAPIYFIKAQIHLDRGEKEKAIETLKYAVSLNEKYYDSVCQLSRAYLTIGQEKEGYAEMDGCIDMGGASLMNSAGSIKNLINHYMGEAEKGGPDNQKNIERLIQLHVKLATLEAGNTKIWINLAKFYAQNGQIEKAIESAQKAAEIDKSLKKSVEEYIRGLGG